MVRDLDPRAEKIKQRKAGKDERKYVTHSTIDAVKLILQTKNAVRPEPEPEDCPRCVELQKRVRSAA